MKSILAYIKAHAILSVVAAAVVVAIGIGVVVKLSSAPKLQTVTPTHQKIVQGVSVTGKVKPAADADLAFERSGTISRVYFAVGAQVKAGDLIVSLNSGDLSADLAQAQAQLQKEQVRLADLRAGNRPENIAISQNQLESARTTLDSANTSAINAIKDAYSDADNAIRNRTDKFFTSPSGSHPILSYASSDSLTGRVQEARVEMQDLLQAFLADTQKLSSTADIDAALETTIARLNQVKVYLDTLSAAVNRMTTNDYLTQTDLDSRRSDISLARADVSGAISAAVTAQNNRNDAVSALATAESEFSLEKAGNTSSDIAAQAAQVQAQASIVAQRQAALSKNFLRSPITGVIAKQDAKAGQIASAGTVLVSVISNAEFQIEANIPEASISKVHMGDAATVSLDAYPDANFEAKVIQIDPAETIVDGVPTYKIVFEFSSVDDRIRSGMTANVDIVSASKENALVVPQRVVFSDAQGSFVRVMRDGAPVVVRIQTGIKGSDGNIEVTEGLNGDEIVIVNTP